VSDDPACESVVRSTRRLADRLRAPWTAVHIETSHSQRLGDAARDRVANTLRLAQRLGGEAVTIPGTDAPSGLIDYAKANNFTHLVIARSHRSRWSELIRGSVTQQLIRGAGDISVHVIAGRQDGPASARAARDGTLWRARPLALRAYGGSLAMVAAALAVGIALQQFLGISNVALVFLMAVLASAITYGLWPALAASLIAVLAYNFFFLPPLYT